MKILIAALLGTLGLTLLLAGWKGTGANLLGVLTAKGSGSSSAPPAAAAPLPPATQQYGSNKVVPAFAQPAYGSPVPGTLLGSIINYPAGTPSLPAGVW